LGVEALLRGLFEGPRLEEPLDHSEARRDYSLEGLAEDLAGAGPEAVQ
jgi:hypothetical protein